MNPDVPKLDDPEDAKRFAADVRGIVLDTIRSFTFNGQPIGVQGSNLVVAMPQAQVDTGSVAFTTTTAPYQGAQSYSTPTPRTPSPSPQPSPVVVAPPQIAPQTFQIPIQQLPQQVQQELRAQPDPPLTASTSTTSSTSSPSPSRNHALPNQAMNHAGPTRTIGNVSGVAVYMQVVCQLNGPV